MIAPQCSGVLLTASPGSSDQRHVRAAVELFGRVGVPLLGAVATSLPHARFGSAGGYGYGYGYGDRLSTTEAATETSTEAVTEAVTETTPAPQVTRPARESKTEDAPK